MKKILTFVLLLSSIFSLSSQEQIRHISLYTDLHEYSLFLSSDEEQKIEVELPPNNYKNKYKGSLPLPITFKWDSKNNILRVKFEGKQVDGDFAVWFFVKNDLQKNMKKENKNLKFSNWIKEEKQINKFWNSNDLELLNVNSNRSLQLEEGAKQEFEFQLINPKSEKIELRLSLYVSKNKKKLGFLNSDVSKFEFLTQVKADIGLDLMLKDQEEEIIQSLIKEIEANTKQLYDINGQIDSLLTENNPEKSLQEKKKDAERYLHVLSEDNKYKDNELVKSALQKNQEIYKDIKEREVKTVRPPETKACKHDLSTVKNMLEQANKELFELTKKIHQAKKDGKNLEAYQQEYKSIVNKVKSNSCSYCNSKNQKSYNAFNAWCKTIDDLF